MAAALQTHAIRARAFNFSRISASLGKRPSARFENSISFSIDTSKMPPLPRTRSLSIPAPFLIAAARLEARGR